MSVRTSQGAFRLILSFLILVLSFGASFFVFFIFTSSREISFAIASLATAIPKLILQSRRTKTLLLRESAWPEAIESVVSALHSGKTVPESLIELDQYGPRVLEGTWIRIRERILSGESLERALMDESQELRSARADQFFATLIFAKTYGGNSVQRSLRHLANFIRDDQQMFEEIETRFGWVKNSAILAAAAPWLLLLLLSAQPGTIESFTTGGGKLLLSCGVIATAIAYLWMRALSRLPETPRIFTFRENVI